MRNVEKRSGENMTGLHRLFFLDMATVSAVKPANNGSVNFDDITISVIKWNELSFVKETAGWEETKDLTDGGPAFNQLIKCLVAKDSIDRLREMKQFIGKELMVIALDLNEVAHLAGYINLQGEKYGMQVSHKMATREKWGDAAKNAYELTMRSQSPAEALQVDISEVPEIDGSMTGPRFTLSGTSGKIYTIDPVPGAVDYIWTVITNPSDKATIVSGQGTNSITVDFLAFTSGLVQVVVKLVNGSTTGDNRSIFG